MFRSLLVPLDRSSLAEQALPWAFAIARHADARVHLVEVHANYGMDDPKACWAPFQPEEDAEYKRNEQLYLDATARWVSAVSPLSVTANVLAGSAVLSETVAESVLDEVHATSTDLIVIATHNRGPLGRFAFGSVAHELVRRSGIPVLLVRAGETPPQLIPEPDLNNVLIPLDGSALAEQVLEPALDLARLMKARCTLMRVIERETQPTSTASERARAEVYLERIAGKIQTDGLEIRTRIVAARSAAEAIMEEAQGQTGTLVALATHGHGGLKRLVMGSVAERLIQTLASPMLVYRPTNGN